MQTHKSYSSPEKCNPIQPYSPENYQEEPPPPPAQTLLWFFPFFCLFIDLVLTMVNLFVYWLQAW